MRFLISHALFLPPPATAVYAVVRCEDHAVRSRVLRAAGNPEFNLRAIFYRRHPDAHISIQVWPCPVAQCPPLPPSMLPVVLLPKPSPLQLRASGLLRDPLLGKARLHTAGPETSCGRVIQLRGGPAGARLRGCVYVETSSSVCLTDL